LIEWAGERASSLEYLEGLEDGIVWAREGVLRLLSSPGLEEACLERADRELGYLVELVQRKKVFVLKVEFEP
jgi:hypothetical protein